MAITDRMLIGAIANNPASFDGAGEYRCCRTCEQIFFTSAKKPDSAHDEHDWFALPSLNPDGSSLLVRAFQRFIKRWPEERQDQLERFALKKGWDMAMELKYGGGALEEQEVAEWQEIVNGRLSQLMLQAREQMSGAAPAAPDAPVDPVLAESGEPDAPAPEASAPADPAPPDPSAPAAPAPAVKAAKAQK